MARFVDLSKKPYQLDTNQQEWVETTLEGMTEIEKIGQLFINLFHFVPDNFTGSTLSRKELVEKFHFGGIRYNGGTAEEVQDLINEAQSCSKIPLLVAANCDSGGNGSCTNGTYIATAAECEASGSTETAFAAGKVSAVEASALGVNINFGPCVDILYNWRNTIINTRAYGTNPDTVIKYSQAFLSGFHSEGNLLSCAKHFPGDGVEDRDQHLLLGFNDFDVEEWDDTYGLVYKHHIEGGIEMIMAGHIALPAYQRKLRPGIKDEEIMPATLSPELITGLLKEQLDFNGVVITDASHMAGLTSAMRREDQVPHTIAAGCDMFLFFGNHEEDFNFMLEGYQKGIITKERLDDACRRILGLKAKLRLYEKKEKGELKKESDDLKVVSSEEHLALRRSAADRSISLIKDTQKVLPIKPETHPRIKLYILHGELANPKMQAPAFERRVIEMLEGLGFQVSLNDPHTRIRGSSLEYRANYDAAIIVSNVSGYGAENNYRIRWSMAGSNEIPWYIWEVPTVFISLNYTTHLTDVPMVKCLINAYHNNQDNLELAFKKMMGESEFRGGHNDLVWCDRFQAKL